MSWSDKAQVYKERKPREYPLWQLLNEHFDEFEERYDELFSKGDGFYRPIISHVVRKFLECGDLHQGFACIRCPDCHHDVLAFGCRGRWFRSLPAVAYLSLVPCEESSSIRCTSSGQRIVPRTAPAVRLQHPQDHPSVFPL